MQDLKIALVQSDLYWEDISANLAMLEEKIWQLKEKVDLIVLPEMFNTGFSMNASLFAEPVNGRTMKWMKQIVSQTGAAVVGSIMIKVENQFFNRLIWVHADKSIYFYDKRHTFTYGGESDVYSKGQEKIIVELNGWKICPLVCYDLRFPEWSRNNVSESNEYDFDVLLYVANWPSTRSYAWNNLLKSRAIENSSYSVGLNRIGVDGRNLEYVGDSQICNPVESLLMLGSDDKISVYSLSFDWLSKYRSKFPFLKDADPFVLN